MTCVVGEGLAGGPSRVTGAAAGRRRADTPAHREGGNGVWRKRRSVYEGATATAYMGKEEGHGTRHATLHGDGSPRVGLDSGVTTASRLPGERPERTAAKPG